MSKTAIRRMVNYGALAMGQGPSTFSTSPLWSPYGQRFWNRSYGQTEDAIVPQTETSVVPFMEREYFGIKMPYLLAIGVLAYLYMNKMPLRQNRWFGYSKEHAAVADLRWKKRGKVRKARKTLKDYHASKPKKSSKRKSSKRKSSAKLSRMKSSARRLKTSSSTSSSRISYDNTPKNILSGAKAAGILATQQGKSYSKAYKTYLQERGWAD